MSDRDGSDNKQAYWNGLKTTARVGTAIVADDKRFPAYWARTEGILGERIAVVEVNWDGVNQGGGLAYLDDREGLASQTVFEKAHVQESFLSIVPGSFVENGKFVGSDNLRDAKKRLADWMESTLGDVPIYPADVRTILAELAVVERRVAEAKAEAQIQQEAIANAKLAAIHSYVIDPGNWSGWDARRKHLLDLLVVGQEGNND